MNHERAQEMIRPGGLMTLLSRRPSMIWALISVVMSLVMYLYYGGAMEMYDSVSYRLAAERLFDTGMLDHFRTPVYPALIWLADKFGSASGLVIWLMQTAIYVWSVVIFRRLAVRLGLSGIPLILVMVFYSVYPGFTLGTATISTESIGTSLAIVCTYCIVRIADGSSWRRVWQTSALIIAMLMLRPAFLVFPLIIILLASAGAVFRPASRPIARKLAVVAASGFMAVIAYNVAVYQVHGITSGSIVSSINRNFVALNNHMLEPEMWDREHRDIVRDINEHGFSSNEQSGYFFELANIYEPSRYQAMADSVWVGHTADYFKAGLKRMFTASTMNAMFIPRNLNPIGGTVDDSVARNRMAHVKSDAAQAYRYMPYEFYNIDFANAVGLLSIPFFVFYVLLAGCGLYMAACMIRHRRLSGSLVWLWLVVASGTAVSIFGGYGDYARLMVETLPEAILLLVIVLSGSFASGFGKKVSAPIHGLWRIVAGYRVMIITGASAVACVAVYMRYGAVACYDTPSYVHAADVLASGIPDAFRTPVYPALLSLGRWAGLWAVVALQIIVYLISVPVLHGLCRRVGLNRRCSLWVTAFYGLYPGFFSVTGLLITESLAVSLMIIGCRLVYDVVNGGRTRHGVILCLLMIIMVMLRPALITFVISVSLVGIFMMAAARYRRTGMVLLVSCAVTGMGVFTYNSAVYKYHEVKAGSYVAAVNILMAWEQIKSGDYSRMPDESVYYKMGLADDSKDGYGVDVSRLQKASDSILMHHRAEYLRGTAERLVNAADDNMLFRGYDMGDLTYFMGMVAVPVWTVVIFMLCLGVYYIRRGLRGRFPDTIETFVYIAAASGMAGVLMMSYGDYDRLLLPVVPLVAILVGKSYTRMSRSRGGYINSLYRASSGISTARAADFIPEA